MIVIFFLFSLKTCVLDELSKATVAFCMRVKTALAPKKLILIAQMKPKAQKICLQSDLRAHLVPVLFKFSFSFRNINKKR